ncbi:MFS transporter [[Bacillus] enclensis]|uniref:MFS transporter n=1 Tax=[Bacillus] enclensis TaxID=1402860 RepID=UPI0018DBFEA4|nr:MFS transporter [[Bacillus] enclensis]MBH9968167.1 MFS transporter [[Bacillus] enclensis]
MNSAKSNTDTLQKEKGNKKNINLLLSSQAMSTLGDNFFNIAIMWAVFAESSSTFQTAMVGTMWHISDVLISPIAGALADRWERKKILFFTNLIGGLFVLSLFVYLLIFNDLTFPLALVLVFIVNGFTCFITPVRSSILPDLVHGTELASVNGKFSVVTNATSMVGNASAGFIVGLIGATWAFLINSMTFFIVSIFVIFLSIPRVQSESPDQFTQNKLNLFKDIKESWGNIKTNKNIKSILMISIFINFASFLGPFYPALVTEKLNGDASIYGYIQAVGVIGSILAGTTIGILSKKIGVGKLISIGWGIAALCIIGVGLSESTYLTILLSLFQLFGITLGGISISTIVMSGAPPNLRGKFIGLVTSLSILIIPIANVTAGLLGEFISVSHMFIIAGIIVLLSACYAFLNGTIRHINISNQPENG